MWANHKSSKHLSWEITADPALSLHMNNPAVIALQPLTYGRNHMEDGFVSCKATEVSIKLQIANVYVDIPRIYAF